MEDTPEISPKEATARFYFTLLYRLAIEDVTKIAEVEKTNLYLCLNVASMMKDQIEREKEELEKMKRKTHI